MVTAESFEFATAGRILFGAGRLDEVGSLVAGFGTRVLVVTGSNTRRAAALIDRLEEVEIYHQVFSVPGEPTTETIQEGVAAARSFSAGIIVAMGGGSAIDAGKAIAAVTTNPGDLFDHLEVIGRARPLVQPPLPFVAIPTTAGTGAEVTRNAVIASPKHQVKVSLRSPLMLPRLAIIDPLLTHDLPAAVTAATGMDALTQLLEPFVSIKATPLTDGFCREGLIRAGRSLKKAVRNGGDAKARSDMALASLLGGLALANAGLGVVHGFAGPIGGRFTAPHGTICAALLAESVRANVAALKIRAPGSPALDRYQEAARLILGKKRATVADLVPWLEELTRDLQIPGLRAFGIQTNQIEEIVRQSRQASSMKGNPIVLDDDELAGILSKSL
ncbi:MAG: alcohol dehydrogenase [Verrucomicrobia bacterium]|nr:MAG: alcohol dehydrogenase [Verrucomicrobiota bacterium]